MDTPSPTVQPGYRRQTPPHRFGSSHAGFAGREAILGPALRGLVLFSCFPLSPPHPPPDTKRGHCFSGRTHRSAGPGPNRTLVHPKDGERTMKRCCGALILMVLGSQVLAQEVLPESPAPTSPLIISEDMTAPAQVYGPGDTSAHSHGGFLSGNHNFPDFIGWMSNPLQNIDPRAVTAIYPLFMSQWVSTAPPIPSGDFQVYGPPITIALSDRFAVGINQGGWADIHFSRNPAERARLIQLDPLGRCRAIETDQTRNGWLNLGGFFQYTLVANVQNQFLLTGGLRWEVPCGSYDAFQGHGPLHLAPYLTAGK